MLQNVSTFFKRNGKKEQQDKSKNAAKERLHLVLMQDRAHVSADFLDLMKQEIVDVIKKYIDVDENEMDVKLANKSNEDGTTGAPALFANIPIMAIKEEAKKENIDTEKEAEKEIAEKETKIKAKKTVSTKKATSKTAKATTKTAKKTTTKTTRKTKKAEETTNVLDENLEINGNEENKSDKDVEKKSLAKKVTKAVKTTKAAKEEKTTKAKKTTTKKTTTAK